MRSQSLSKSIASLILAALASWLVLVGGACKKAPLDVQGAIVTALKGTLTVTRPSGSSESLSASAINTKEAILAPGTVVSTGADGQADLAFTTGTVLRLAAGSKLTITAARILSEQNFTQAQLRLDGGRLFVKSEKLGQTSRLTVVTPTSIASVRGTEFLVKTDAKGTTTLVGEGSVAVSDEKVTEVKTVEPGSKADVPPSGDVVVKPQTDEDKKELNNISQGVQGLTEQGRQQMQSIVQTFEEQKKLIQQSLDEQKRVNQDLIEGQKAKDRDMVKGQSDRDREMLRDQIRRDQEMMEKVRGDAQKNADEVKDKGRADQDAVRGKTQGDMDAIKKKSENKELDKTRSELDRLKKMQ